MAEATSAPSAAPALPAVRVLVIDDSNTIRRSAEIFLRQGGHEVVLAEDGFDALAKVNDHTPDLIFCDILMPRLDGYQTCAIIKRNPRFTAVPIIMLSSKDGVFDKARGRMVGSEDYLTKPFTKEQLLRAVAQYHPLRAAGATGQKALTRRVSRTHHADPAHPPGR
jgi:twitching motility two-component system response regulator PilG